ncbi:hypothetical protein BJ742DRAFT_231166 [Cladochytrium replicatum]|nr:hypothetical protein BJ742DRAFT_231166 [Cladochytrium replicatum]
MTVRELKQRLISKRPHFFGAIEMTLLCNGSGLKDLTTLERVGNTIKSSDLSLEEYLPVDEMVLSALIGVSTETFFINNGSRSNRAIKDPHGNINGVVCWSIRDTGEVRVKVYHHPVQ